MSTSVLFIVLLCLCGVAVSSSTYYVRTDGSDSCNGTANAASSASPNCAFHTLLKAINTAAAGDSVMVASGTYSSSNALDFSGSGTSSSRITFSAQPGTVLKANVVISGDYVTFTGFIVSPPTVQEYYAVSVEGNHDIFTNCTVINYGASASDQATAIGLSGSFNTVSNCTIRDLIDIDAFHVFGNNHLILNNLITNLSQVNYDENHSDFIQTWGLDSSLSSFNILIIGNTVTNSSIQLGNTETDDNTKLHDWTFYNNIFADIDNSFFWGLPNSRFIANVFYNVGKNQGYALSLYDQPSYSSENVTIVNNVFVANVDDVNFHSADVSELFSFSNNFYATQTGGTKSGTMGSAKVNGGNALFVNPAKYDFHLQSGSVLIGAGLDISIYGITTDKDGNALSAPYDIGPLKYVTSSSSTPSPTSSPSPATSSHGVSPGATSSSPAATSSSPAATSSVPTQPSTTSANDLGSRGSKLLFNVLMVLMSIIVIML